MDRVPQDIKVVSSCAVHPTTTPEWSDISYHFDDRFRHVPFQKVKKNKCLQVVPERISRVSEDNPAECCIAPKRHKKASRPWAHSGNPVVGCSNLGVVVFTPVVVQNISARVVVVIRSSCTVGEFGYYWKIFNLFNDNYLSIARTLATLNHTLPCYSPHAPPPAAADESMVA